MFIDYLLAQRVTSLCGDRKVESMKGSDEWLQMVDRSNTDSGEPLD